MTGPRTDTRTKLLDGALSVLGEAGIAGASARAIASAAGVNQALVFYHYGSVEALLAAACEHGAQQRVDTYRARLADITTLGELLALGRELHTQERTDGNIAVLGQLLAGSQNHPELARATAAGLGRWTTEIETVLARVLATTPFSEFVDVRGLAKAVAASFIGLELYEGADPEGAQEALAALEQLAALAGALDELGPVAQRAVRSRLRRTTGRRGRDAAPEPQAAPARRDR